MFGETCVSSFWFGFGNSSFIWSAWSVARVLLVIAGSIVLPATLGFWSRGLSSAWFLGIVGFVVYFWVAGSLVPPAT